MNTICKKIHVIGIILLFVGVSVSSAISIDNKPKISQDENEEDCRCNEVSDADIVKLEKQLVRLGRHSKLLLVLSDSTKNISHL